MFPHKSWISKISLITARVYRILMSWLSSCRQAARLLFTWIVYALRWLARPTYGIWKFKAYLCPTTFKIHFRLTNFKWICEVELTMVWNRPLNLEMDSALEDGSWYVWYCKHWTDWRAIMWFWLVNDRR